MLTNEMLSELKQANERLREKLQSLRTESSRLCGETQRYLNTSMMEVSIAPSTNVSSSRYHCFSEMPGPLPSPCGGISSLSVLASSRISMLSDRAKHVRGEATRHIDEMLHDWRDYKSRADDEIRHRHRTEHLLRESLSRREKESCEMMQELTSLRAVILEQKDTIDRLTDGIEGDEKCRTKCAELELQVTKLQHHVTSLSEENFARNEIIQTCEAERASLAAINSELHQRNREQLRTFDSCERDVSETRMELETLEEMVRTLNERKINLLPLSSSYSERTAIPNTTSDFSYTRQHYLETMASKASASATTPSYHTRDNIDPISHNSSTNGSAQSPESLLTNTRQAKLLKDGSDRTLANRHSAMSTLKSLQKEHSEKCNSLAQQIQKLKDESQMKEKTISSLQAATSKKDLP